MVKVTNNVLAVLSILVIVLSLISTLMVVNRATELTKIGVEMPSGVIQPSDNIVNPPPSSSVGKVGVVIASYEESREEGT